MRERAFFCFRFRRAEKKNAHLSFFLSTPNQSHWPFHREDCRSNAFADAIEESEPNFATWLRRHGKQVKQRKRKAKEARKEERDFLSPKGEKNGKKHEKTGEKNQAALRDGDVGRLEQASQAACSPVSRQELMNSMWGKADPSPAGPTWGPEGEEKMAAAAGQRLLEREMELRKGGTAARAALRAWSSPDALPPPPPPGEHDGGGSPLGGECGRLWRWWQTPTRVEVVVSLFEVRRELRRASRKPPSRRRKKGQRQPAVEVSIRPRGLSVSLPSGGGAADRDDENGEEKKVDLLSGTLFKKIAVDGSTWHVSDGSLFVSLLKLSWRGCYADGDTAAETWWRSMFEMEEEAGEGAEEKKKEEVKGGKDGEARPTTKTTTTTTTLASCSSPPASSFLKLPEPLPASAPLSYYALQRDPDDEGGFVVATRRRR